MPHLASVLTEDLAARGPGGRVVVIGNGSPEFTRLKELGLQNRTVVDLARIPGLARDQGLDYHGITW